MTYGDTIICLILVIAAVIAACSIIKHKKHGGCPCGGDCGCCGGHCHCHKHR